MEWSLVATLLGIVVAIIIGVISWSCGAIIQENVGYVYYFNFSIRSLRARKQALQNARHDFNKRVLPITPLERTRIANTWLHNSETTLFETNIILGMIDGVNYNAGEGGNAENAGVRNNTSDAVGNSGNEGENVENAGGNAENAGVRNNTSDAVGNEGGNIENAGGNAENAGVGNNTGVVVGAGRDEQTCCNVLRHHRLGKRAKRQIEAIDYLLHMFSGFHDHVIFIPPANPVPNPTHYHHHYSHNYHVEVLDQQGVQHQHYHYNQPEGSQQTPGESSQRQLEPGESSQRQLEPGESSQRQLEPGESSQRQLEPVEEQRRKQEEELQQELAKLEDVLQHYREEATKLDEGLQHKLEEEQKLLEELQQKLAEEAPIQMP